ncbi:hypothetical protein FA13DRAFT_1744859 [Coprinellus micaceus]|uniref:Uncharacterized protein n=1 Tax=Coprinellus micaceus TaxID=71717 RepID=A0A4Y7SBM2_COPMI|nr:hypothetical protein FA13DRAFT_1744859 [Coprinellus micaceus]
MQFGGHYSHSPLRGVVSIAVLPTVSGSAMGQCSRRRVEVEQAPKASEEAVDSRHRSAHTSADGLKMNEMKDPC